MRKPQAKQTERQEGEDVPARRGDTEIIASSAQIDSVLSYAEVLTGRQKKTLQNKVSYKNFQTNQVEYKHFTNRNMNSNNDENQSTNSTPRTETSTKAF